MSDIGYLQIKIGENKEKILQGENRIKKLELEIKIQEQNFSQAIRLIQDAMDITSYKNEIEKIIKESSRIAFSKLFNKNVTKISKNIENNIISKIRHDFIEIQKVLELHKDALDSIEVDFMVISKKIFKDSNELFNGRKKFKRFEQKFIKK